MNEMLSQIYEKFDVVIGLEIHCQLKTKTKLFATSSYSYGSPPNSCLDAITLGLPGALPQVNGACVELAVRMGFACQCEIQKVSRFVRKNYFYPDLPKGYQISQLHEPICRNGFLKLSQGQTIRIQQIQLEEDAGKNIHLEDQSLLDFNRAGVGLIEIVTAPDLRRPEEVREFLKTIHQIAVELDVTEGSLEKGQMRADANISLKPKGRKELGERVEVKNVNSFKFIEKAVIHEIERQAHLLSQGESIARETRSYDHQRHCTNVLRTKENLQDYRYFWEPDLPPLVLADEAIEGFRKRLKPTFFERRNLLKERFPNLPSYDLEVIANWEAGMSYFLKLVEGMRPNSQEKLLKVSRFYMGPLLAIQKQLDQEERAREFLYPLDWSLSLLDSFLKGQISERQMKVILEKSAFNQEPPSKILSKEEISQTDDEDIIRDCLRDLIEKNPQEVERYLAGRTRLLGFFVGQAMKISKGCFHPQKTSALAQALLEEKRKKD